MWPAIIAAGASIASGLLKHASAQEQSSQEYDRQKEFAQNGISWKVADAKRAGLHPLYAIGAQGASYTPQSTIGTDYGLGDAGQNIANAVNSYQSPQDKAHAKWVNKTTELLNLRNMQLQNDLISQQIKESESRINHQPGNPVSFPVPFSKSGRFSQSFSKAMGIPPQNLVEVKPDEVVAGAPEQPQGEAALKRDIMYVMDENGNLAYYPSQAIMDYVSESYLDNIIWKLKAMRTKPDKYYWAPGAVDYRPNYLLQRWEPVFRYDYKESGNARSGGSAW